MNASTEWEWATDETISTVHRIAARVTAARLPASTDPARLREASQECAAIMLTALAADPALAANIDALFLVADAEAQATRNAEAWLHSRKASRAYRGDEIRVSDLENVTDPAERRALASRLTSADADSLTPAKVDAILAAITAAGSWDARALRPGHEADHAGNVREPMSATTVAMMRPTDIAADTALRESALRALAAPVVTLTAGTTLTAEQQRAVLLAAYQWDAAPLTPRESAVDETDQLRATRGGGVERWTGGKRQARVTRNGRDAHTYKRRRAADAPAPRFDPFTADLLAGWSDGFSGPYRERGAGNSPGASRFGYRAATLNYAAIARAVFGPDADAAAIKRVTRFLREWARVALDNVDAVIDAGRTPTGLAPYPVIPDAGRRVAPRGRRTQRAAFTLRGNRVARAVERRERDKRVSRAALDAGRAPFKRSLTPAPYGPHRGSYVIGTREYWRDATGTVITARAARQERIGGRPVYRYAAAGTGRVVTTAPRATGTPGAPVRSGRVVGVSGADRDRYAAWSAVADAVSDAPSAVVVSDPATVSPRASSPTARTPRTGTARASSGARVVVWDANGYLPVLAVSRNYGGDALPYTAPTVDRCECECGSSVPGYHATTCAAWRVGGYADAAIPGRTLCDACGRDYAPSYYPRHKCKGER